VQTLGGERLRNLAWIETTGSVDQLSKGEVGYVYVRTRASTARTSWCDVAGPGEEAGLIIDERFNSGARYRTGSSRCWIVRCAITGRCAMARLADADGDSQRPKAMLINAGGFGRDCFPFYFSSPARPLIACAPGRVDRHTGSPPLSMAGGDGAGVRDLQHNSQWIIEGYG